MADVANNEITTKKQGGRSGKGFMPGKSGNPKGRPKQTEEQQDALQAIRNLAPNAAEVLKGMLYDEGIPPAQRLRAAEMILDRTYGKAEAKVDMQAKVAQGDFVLKIGQVDDGADY